MARPQFRIREGYPRDIEPVIEFIYEHGDNGLNYLEPIETKSQVREIETGETLAMLAFRKSLLVGVVTYAIEHNRHDFLGISLPNGSIGHVEEAVVHKDYVGKGIGGRLFSGAIIDMMKMGAEGVFATHHADNVSSARMMEKNHMLEVARYDDPLRRTIGTPQTVIRALSAKRLVD